MAKYDRGQPTVARKIAAGTYECPSWRSPGTSYTVMLEGQKASCDCLHHLTRGKECKHIATARAARYEELVAVAQTLAESDLCRLLEKYEAKGDLLLALALRGEIHDRLQAQGFAA